MKPTAEQMLAFSPWQECYDENSGYTYYWNMTTNEVTWEIPAVYQLALQKWQLLQQQLLASASKKSDGQESQLSLSSVSQKLESKKNEMSKSKTASSLKKKYPFESDTDEDEKIELITSYGSDSSDNSDSESSKKSKTLKSKKLKTESSKTKGQGSSLPKVSKKGFDSSTSSIENVVHGPSLPPDLPVYGPLLPEKLPSPDKSCISLVPYGLDTSDNLNADESSDSESSLKASASPVSGSSPERHSKKRKKSETISTEKEISNSPCKDTLSDSSKNVCGTVKIKEDLFSNQSKVKSTEEVSKNSDDGCDSESNKEDEDDEDFDEDENIILSKLRSQALILKQLGGEIPEEIKCLIDGDSSNVGIDDIIALIENETPPDHVEKSVSETSGQTSQSLINGATAHQETSDLVVEGMETQKEKEITDDNNTANKSSVSSQPSSFALIASYGEDSDGEENASPVKSSSSKKPLFPSVEKPKKNLCENSLSSKPVFKKIKLSARAKALINASMITAKARATSIIQSTDADLSSTKRETETDTSTQSADNLTEEVPEKVTESGNQASKIMPTGRTVEKVAPQVKPLFPISEKVETLKEETVKKELKVETDNHFIVGQPVSSSLSTSELKLPSSKPKLFNSSSTSAPASSSIESKQACSYTTIWNTASTYSADEKRGFGFSNDSNPSSSSPMDSFYPSKKTLKPSGIQFIKAETINVEKTVVSLPVPEIPKSNENEKTEITSLSELIIEKVKYLSEGKDSVSPVQIMAIQIETLMSAWEVSSLSGKYLLEWLKDTSKQLSTLEDAAAPTGWKCEWDRSFNRYYYRNLETGSIQWEYPAVKETEEIGGEVEMELCETPPPPPDSPPPPLPPPPCKTPPPEQLPSPPKTPPPPVISFSPPPPPIISKSEKTEKKILSSTSGKKTSSKSKAVTNASPDESFLPPLPSSPPPLPPCPPPLSLKSSATSSPALPVTIPSPPVDLPLPPGVDPIESVFEEKRKKIVKPASNSSNSVLGRAPPPPPPSYPPNYSQPQSLLPDSKPLVVPHPPTTAPPPPPPPIVSSKTVSGPKAEASASYQVCGAPIVKTLPPLPPSIPPQADLTTVLDSFYSDLANLEATVPDCPSTVEPVVPPIEGAQSPVVVPSEPEPVNSSKKRKKMKLAAGLTLKKKGLSSLVEKWEKVQKTVGQNLCD